MATKDQQPDRPAHDVQPPEDGPIQPSRRRFLARSLGTGGGILALGASSLGLGGKAWAADGASGNASADSVPDLPKGVRWKDADSVIVHNPGPIGLETERDAIGTSGMTPDTRLYVRNNLPLPDATIVADRDAWEVEFAGVQNPKTLKLADLKTMGLVTVPMVLQCSGNGRGFFEHETSGSQWLTGAAGNVIWSGVPLRTVVEALGGPVDGAKYLTSTGGEELPEGLPEDLVKVERSVPLEKGMDDVLLAWEMNGAPVPLAHGGPLRVVVPGYYGCNNVKYVKRVALTPKESTAKIQQTSYRIRPIGEKGAPDQPTMWDMNVNSWITRPGTEGTEKVAAGEQMITGVAFGGNVAVEGVEVSTDGGKNWQKAGFVGPDMGPYAWRTFVLPVKLAAGTHTLASRATSVKGDTQPEKRMENERGYGNNSWRDHALDIEVS